MILGPVMGATVAAGATAAVGVTLAAGAGEPVGAAAVPAALAALAMPLKASINAFAAVEIARRG